MVFKILYKPGVKLVVLFCLLIFTAGCSNDGKNSNTFCVELVNFKYDTLKRAVSDKIFGKASFYKNDKLEIVSSNYITGDVKDPHYFQNFEAPESKIENGAKKIRVELAGDYSIDSIKYSLQKFIYKNDAWQKISDMGFIKAQRTTQQERFVINDFAGHIQRNVVMYTYE